MGLEQAIHARWAADSGLSALVPGERLFTGVAASDAACPYAVLSRLGSRGRLCASGGTTVEKVLVRIVVWTADLDAGQQIASEVQRVFDRSDFAFTGGVVRNLQNVNRVEQVAEDGGWRIALEYLALVETTSA